MTLAVRARRLLALVAAAGGLAACNGPSRIDSVLIVSIDTCRADHLSSYGYARETTPHIDALAAEGVRFRRALAPVPLTLPAHASLLTGTIPPAHGVRGNATSRLPPASVTLAEALAEHGLATGAVVSAFVLDSRFGLDQGFDSYDDTFEDPVTTNVVSERRGGEATERAIHWLGQHAAQPFFLFLHYYDPHMLYEPPEPFASRFAGDPYAGEIAYVDAGVGTVVAELKRLGAYDRTLIVVTSDHGEMLEEHGEESHGWFVYEGAIRVPLIFRGSGLEPAVVEDLAGLVDVAPTVLGALGLPAPAGMTGVDLSPALRGGRLGPRALYAESLEPTLYDCNPLLALAGERFKYVLTTRPELYDVVEDPGETNNIAARDADRASEMKGLLLALAAASSRAADAPALDGETRRRIEALGYVAGTGPVQSLVEPGRDDPKDLLPFHLSHLSILPLVARGELTEARRRAEELLARRPGFVDGHLLLARIARDERRMDDAIRHYERALVLRPGLAGVHADLGVALALAGHGADAIDQYRRALAIDPDHVEAWNNLGNALLAAGRGEEALASYMHAVELRPDSAEAQLNAGIALLRLGRPEQARAYLARAAAAGSRDPRTLEALAAAVAALDRS